MIEQPTAGAFGFPAASISPQCTPTWRRWFYTVFADEIRPAVPPVLCAGWGYGPYDHKSGDRSSEAKLAGSAGAQSASLPPERHWHNLEREDARIRGPAAESWFPLPVLSFRHRRSFFAEQNLTSPNASDQTISCRRSKYSSNCCYASWNTPSSVYSLK